MKVVLATSQFPPTLGGVPKVYENLCRHLPGKIAVFTCPATGSQSIELPQTEIYRTRTPFSLSSTLPWPLSTADLILRDQWWNRSRISSEFADFLDRVRPDAVCIGTLHSVYWLAPVARARSLPVFYYSHGEEISGIRPSRLEGDRPRNELLRADAFIAVSDFTKRALIGLGVDTKRIDVITNGVELERFTPGAKDPALISRYGLAGRKILLTFSRLDERKGQDQVIRALPAILDQYPETVYVIAGSGSFENRLRQLVVDLELSENVVFTGLVSEAEVAAHYRLADIFVMPNRTLPNGDTEGFGIVFLEAGACGVPVVGGNAGGVPSAIDHDVTGLLVDGTSVAEIAAALIKLLGDGNLRAAMGATGRNKALENTWAEKARRFEQFVRNLT